MVRKKDIYVENFTDKTDEAVIYARVKLDEYLSIGADAVTAGTAEITVDLDGDGTATGCLLTGIERSGSIVSKYYYG